MEEQKQTITVTIDDIENERVEFESGIWVFIAGNLLELRDRLRDSLVPKDAKRKNIKQMKVHPIISKF